MAEILRKNNEIVAENSRSLYLQILGSQEITDNVSEMPQNIFVPKTFLGNIEESIINTDRDLIERSQSVFVDRKNGNTENGPVFIGTDKDTGDKEALNRAFRVFFAKKHFLQWHTHSHGIWYFSTKDVTTFRSYPRQAYIDIVGSSEGVVALFQTREAMKMPISSVILFNKIFSDLNGQSFIQKSNVETTRILRNLGFAYYFWFPKNGVREGSISNGITLTKFLC